MYSILNEDFLRILIINGRFCVPKTSKNDDYYCKLRKKWSFVFVFLLRIIKESIIRESIINKELLLGRIINGEYYYWRVLLKESIIKGEYY